MTAEDLLKSLIYLQESIGCQCMTSCRTTRMMTAQHMYTLNWYKSHQIGCQVDNCLCVVDSRDACYFNVQCNLAIYYVNTIFTWSDMQRGYKVFIQFCILLLESVKVSESGIFLTRQPKQEHWDVWCMCTCKILEQILFYIIATTIFNCWTIDAKPNRAEEPYFNTVSMHPSLYTCCLVAAVAEHISSGTAELHVCLFTM